MRATGTKAGAPGARRLPLVLALVLAVAVGVVLPAPADAQLVTEARGIDRVCPAPASTDADGETPPVTFPDLDTTHADAITCAAGYELVTGFADGTFQPDEPITRGQMATFVASWIRTATGIPLTMSAVPRFPDAVDSVHVRSIEALAQAGIVSGRPDGTYGATETLSRGQFSRAVAGAISYADILAVGGPLPEPGTAGVFEDVAGTTFETTILALAGSGIALGVEPGRFAPDAPVTRGQLATFLLRSADLLDVYQRWQPTALDPVELTGTFVPLDDRWAPLPDPVADALATEEDAAGGGSTDGTDGTSGTAGPTAEVPDGGEEETGTDLPLEVGQARLAMDAFGSVLEHELDLPDPGGLAGTEVVATLHLGAPTATDPPVLVLRDDIVLTPGITLRGTSFEADATTRFAVLLASDQGLSLRLLESGTGTVLAVAELASPTP